MKLCIAGKNNIAVDCLYYALNFFNSEEICVTLNKTDSHKNLWQKSLGFYAKKENISIKTLEEVKMLKDIVFLSLEYDRIIKPEQFKTNSFYNIHFSLLPEYKGMYTSLLPILHGKEYSGVTLHKMDKGIDTGDIAGQIKFNILGLTSKELYNKYLEKGTKLVFDNFEYLINNNIKATPQASCNSTYYGKNAFSFNSLDFTINPVQTAYQISRFVKALNFRVYQMPKFNNHEIYRAEITTDKSLYKPGKIVKEDGEKMIISTIDYDIILFKDYYRVLVDACKENNIESAKKLIRYIKDTDEKNYNGWTPLMIACYNGSYDLVKVLIDNGANVHVTNYNGTTTLMYSISHYLKNRKSLSIIKLLIDNNVDIWAKDIYGKNIFDYIQDSKLIKYLKVFI